MALETPKGEDEEAALKGASRSSKSNSEKSADKEAGIMNSARKKYGKNSNFIGEEKNTDTALA